jgi:membrane protein
MFKNLWGLFRKTFSEWGAAKVPRLAAALSYYTIFSIPPLLAFLLGIAGLFFDPEQVKQAILTQMGVLLTSQTAGAIEGLIGSTIDKDKGAVATAVGLLVLLLGASGVFGQLQDALNTIWEVAPKPGQGLGLLVRKRLLSFLVVLGLGFLLLVSLVISAALAVLTTWIQSMLPGTAALAQVITFLVSLLVATLLFGFMYAYIPDARVAWKDVWLGAFVTSLLFNLGKTLLSLYMGVSNPASAFGAAASVALILVWVYYSAQILFFGASFTKVYAEEIGSGIEPESHAEKVTPGQRAKEGLSPHGS